MSRNGGPSLLVTATLASRGIVSRPIFSERSGDELDKILDVARIHDDPRVDERIARLVLLPETQDEFHVVETDLETVGVTCLEPHTR